MMKKLLAMATMLALAAAPLALAHDGHNNGKADKVFPGPNPHCWPTQNPHDYGEPGSAEWDIVGQSGGGGVVGVSNYNIEDCGVHDSTKKGPAHPGDADFDGDFEYGTGGGFFPAGPWANEPLCNRGYVDHHHTEVHVHDAIWPYDKDDPQLSALHNSVSFTVGADPSPPVSVNVPPKVIPVITRVDLDGVQDSGDEVATPEIVIAEQSWACVTDGCICPGIDPNDWLKTCLHKCPIFPPPPGNEDNPSYGEPGGDGGFWVFVNCNLTTDGDFDLSLADTDGDTIPDSANPSVTPPTTMGGTCSTNGHIYFPNTWPGKHSALVAGLV